MIIGLIVLACGAAGTVMAAADPYDPVVPCWRSQPGSTFQKWTFVASNNPAAPEVSINLSGTPQAGFAVGNLGKGWVNTKPTTFGTNQGIWDMGASGTITLSIPNSASVAPAAYKYVWVQVVQFIGNLTYQTYATVSVPGGTSLGGQRVSTGYSVSTGGGHPLVLGTWMVDQTVWLVPDGSSPTTVTITSDAYGDAVDQIVVDTLSLDLCPGNITQNTDPGQCTAAVTMPLPTVDGCKVVSVVCKTNSVVISSPNTFPVGTTPVACTITDGASKITTCPFTVTVNDVTPPTAVCQNISVNLDATGHLTITPAQVNNGSSDACGILSLALDKTAFTCANAGPNAVVLTVTDN